MPDQGDLCPSCDPVEDAERLEGIHADVLTAIERRVDNVLGRAGLPDDLSGEVDIEYNEERERPQLHLAVMENGRCRPVWSAWYALPSTGLTGWLEKVREARPSETEPTLVDPAAHWVDDLEYAFKIGDYAPEEPIPEGGPFYCAVCGVESERPHDHSEDSPQPLVPLWRLER